MHQMYFEGRTGKNHYRFKNTGAHSSSNHYACLKFDRSPSSFKFHAPVTVRYLYEVEGGEPNPLSLTTFEKVLWLQYSHSKL